MLVVVQYWENGSTGRGLIISQRRLDATGPSTLYVDEDELVEWDRYVSRQVECLSWSLYITGNQ